MKKTGLILLALLACGSVMVSCGSDDSANNGAVNGGADTEGETAVTEAVLSEKEQGKADFFANLGTAETAGTEVTFIAINVGDEILTMNDIYTDTLNGSMFNDAVYKRTVEIEEKVGIRINCIGVDEDSVQQENIKKDTMSGDGVYDIISAKTCTAGALFNNGLLSDLNALPVIDFSKPWWNQNANTNFSLGGYQPVALSSVCHYGDNVAWFLMFNKYLMESYDLENPYQLVRDGKWTIDKMYEMMSAVPVDSNGNGKTDADDIFGCIAQGFDASALMTSFGVTYYEKDANDIPTFVLDNPTNVDKFDKVFNFFADSARVMNIEKYRGQIDKLWDTWGNKIAKDEGLFMLNCAGNLTTYTDMQHDFGIVPIPKYDEAQESYYTMTSIWFTTCLAVPKVHGASDRDIALTMEAISYLSYVDVEPLFAQTYLENRFIRDEESAEMLNLVIAGKKYDPGFVFNWNNSMLIPQEVISAKTNTFASSIAKKRKGIESAMNASLKVLSE